MSEFVEVKTADLVGAALDWAVAKAEISPMEMPPKDMWSKYFAPCSPSADWKYGGPLIEKFAITLAPYSPNPKLWIAEPSPDLEGSESGATPLIAACRAIVASVLGETVSVPKELLS